MKKDETKRVKCWCTECSCHNTAHYKALICYLCKEGYHHRAGPVR